jgi:hypothetical protein
MQKELNRIKDLNVQQLIKASKQNNNNSVVGSKLTQIALPNGKQIDVTENTAPVLLEAVKERLENFNEEIHNKALELKKVNDDKMKIEKHYHLLESETNLTKAEKKKIEDKIKEMHNEQIKLKEEIKDLTKEKTKSEDSLNAMKEKIAEYEKNVEKLTKATNQYKEQVEKAKDDVKNLSIEKVRIQKINLLPEAEDTPKVNLAIKLGVQEYKNKNGRVKSIKGILDQANEKEKNDFLDSLDLNKLETEPLTEIRTYLRKEKGNKPHPPQTPKKKLAILDYMIPNSPKKITRDSGFGIDEEEKVLLGNEEDNYLNESGDENNYPEGKGKGEEEGLYDYQIEQIMSPYKKKGFKGVYASDEINNIPLKKDEKFSFVMNLDKHNQAGSHWIAVFCDPNPKTGSLDYYDPLADEPSEDFMKRIKKLIEKINPETYLKFKVNRVKEQNASSNCGWHSMRFLMDRYKGKPFIDASGFSKIRESEKKAKIMKKKFGYL